MLSYIIALLAFGLFFLDPVLRFLSPGGYGPGVALRRTPRPPIDESLLALEEGGGSRNGTGADQGVGCPPDAYSVHIFSKDPLVLYVENFLSADERAHLLEISEPIFEPSTVTHDGGATVHRDAVVRDSEVALVPRTETVRCVEARARALQGWRDELWLERLRVQRYRPGGHYAHHFDRSAARAGWGRVGSMMVFVGDGGGELRGGGTEFPLLRRRSADPRWCRLVECDEAGDDAGGAEGSGGRGEGRERAEEADRPGVVFRPVPGNAVFWENFRPDGTGTAYEETWHAGLAVTEGVKVGLNIWSWGRTS